MIVPDKLFAEHSVIGNFDSEVLTHCRVPVGQEFGLNGFLVAPKTLNCDGDYALYRNSNDSLHAVWVVVV